MPKYKIVRAGLETGSGYELLLWGDGDKWYYLDGEQHREDGPSIERSNGDKHWYLNGVTCNKKWFLKNPEKIAEMQAWDLFEPEELVRLCLNTKK